MKYDIYKTSKGTELPLINLKGRPYMQVAHRLIWFTEDVPSYTTTTEFLSLSDSRAVAKVTVNVLDKDGRVVKSATATKVEDTKGFADFTEKAETGALGRALAMLGYGTQFAIADLEEGDRLADSPVVIPSEVKAQAKPEVKSETKTTDSSPKPPPFKRTKPTETKKSSEDMF